MCNNVNQSLSFNNSNIFTEEPILLFLIHFACFEYVIFQYVLAVVLFLQTTDHHVQSHFHFSCVA